ncbi:DUF747-domain-containing protein [Rozella allomycis CSF55]|uniref:DUF747-domain-containing protein n=1 Tax=Rozella allomycis (strain CSF55) TaxID=988480 RepID=A0A075AZH2_ROZAC|nr:Membrane protein,Tapt1/CMV receptor domain-containing protein [Rozella allomycis CSF55]RKP21467.1 DUF747-domain-containing protein [Rozella allomycis CSF55]|eukprot:EPZ35710.1 Membrane protein,Tapt1/CMV receptor domain-containing protein [Rozella allomycis CSF55]
MSDDHVVPVNENVLPLKNEVKLQAETIPERKSSKSDKKSLYNPWKVFLNDLDQLDYSSSQALKRERVYNFLLIPNQLEKDILDSYLSSFLDLQDTKMEEHQKLRPFTHFVLSVIYVFVHAVVFFYQSVCLNVAINSYHNALLTLLISNQFVEIKGAVFKRFEKENLFQMTCSDIVERVQLSFYLIIIGLRNMIEMGDSLNKWDYFFNTLGFQLLVVFVCEICVDWLKHAFICKFNLIRPIIYGKYRDVLSNDLTKVDKPVDNSAFVARRIGFASIPATAFIIRVAIQLGKMFGLNSREIVTYGLILFLCLLCVKLLLSHLILRWANNNVQKYENPGPIEFSFPHVKVGHQLGKDFDNAKIQVPVHTLENIDRYTLVKSRIP